MSKTKKLRFDTSAPWIKRCY